MGFFFIVLAFLALTVNLTFAGSNVVCYVGTWANYRAGNGKFTVENIDPTICTHLVYSFFGVNSDGTIAILDPYLDLTDNYGLGTIQRFNNLKRANPTLKTLAAVGGWNFGSAKFSAIANSASLRTKFASEARAFCQKHGFDGIDMDWEYPAQRDGNASVDKANFILMMKALYTELKSTGAPASKLVMGMPLYGKSYTLRSAAQNGVGASVSAAGKAGPHTQEPGYLGYNEICELKLAGRWTEIWNNVQKVPYGYNGDQWAGYDNVQSIVEKCGLIKSLGLAGGMFWSLETDDFLGQCGNKFGLVSALKGCLAGTTTVTKAPTVATTTKGTVTDVATKVPVTTTTSRPSSGSFVCQATGYFRDPIVCTKFYYCSGTLRYDFVCPAGLYFMPQTVQCDYPRNVKCP